MKKQTNKNLSTIDFIDKRFAENVDYHCSYQPHEIATIAYLCLTLPEKQKQEKLMILLEKILSLKNVSNSFKAISTIGRFVSKNNLSILITKVIAKIQWWSLDQAITMATLLDRELSTKELLTIADNSNENDRLKVYAMLPEEIKNEYIKNYYEKNLLICIEKGQVTSAVDTTEKLGISLTANEKNELFIKNIDHLRTFDEAQENALLLDIDIKMLTTNELAKILTRLIICGDKQVETIINLLSTKQADVIIFDCIKQMADKIKNKYTVKIIEQGIPCDPEDETVYNVHTKAYDFEKIEHAINLLSDFSGNKKNESWLLFLKIQIDIGSAIETVKKTVKQLNRELTEEELFQLATNQLNLHIKPSSNTHSIFNPYKMLEETKKIAMQSSGQEKEKILLLIINECMRLNSYERAENIAILLNEPLQTKKLSIILKKYIKNNKVELAHALAKHLGKEQDTLELMFQDNIKKANYEKANQLAELMNKKLTFDELTDMLLICFPKDYEKGDRYYRETTAIINGIEAIDNDYILNLQD